MEIIRDLEATKKPYSNRPGVSVYDWDSIDKGKAIFIPDANYKKRKANDLKTTANQWAARRELEREWEAWRTTLDGTEGVWIQRVK